MGNRCVSYLLTLGDACIGNRWSKNITEKILREYEKGSYTRYGRTQLLYYTFDYSSNYNMLPFYCRPTVQTPRTGCRVLTSQNDIYRSAACTRRQRHSSWSRYSRAARPRSFCCFRNRRKCSSRFPSVPAHKYHTFLYFVCPKGRMMYGERY